MFTAKHLERSVHTDWPCLGTSLLFLSPLTPILFWPLCHLADAFVKGTSDLCCVLTHRFSLLSWTPLFSGLSTPCPCLLDAPSAGHRLHLHCAALRSCSVPAQRGSFSSFWMTSATPVSLNTFCVWITLKFIFLAPISLSCGVIYPNIS